MAGKADGVLMGTEGFKQDKARLEKKLNETRHKRRELELSLDQAVSKHDQLFNKHSRMNDTLNVSRHKADSAQRDVIRQRTINETRSKELADLNIKLTELEKKKLCNVQAFEKELSALTGLFVNASQKYTEEGLQEEISRIREEKIAVTTDLEESEIEIGALADILAKTHLVADTDSDDVIAIRKKQLDDVKEENKKAHKRLAEAKERSMKLKNELELLKIK